MEIIWSGFILGIMGSFHCVGMCGPIALSLPLYGNNFGQKAFGGILYNIGRTVTYAVMGAFFGFVGQSFEMVGFQQWISVVMGSLMILSILIPSIFKSLNVGTNFPLSAWVRKHMSKLFQKKSFSRLFFIGLLNGLLPCGLVYLAIAGAIGTANTLYGIFFMILFGLGTLPMLLAVSLAGSLISVKVRNRINKVIPFVVVLIGIIFILRGLSIGIPYLSPPKKKLNPEIHMQNADNESSENVKGSCCHGE